MPEHLVAQLRAHRLKATPQRISIFGYLRASTAHPRADTVYRDLKPAFPSLSLATVYKTLERLTQAGLAEVINLGDGHLRFDGNTAPHSHLICRSCGRVEDLDDSSLVDLTAQVEQRSGYRITGQALYFYGNCPRCRQLAGEVMRPDA